MESPEEKRMWEGIEDTPQPNDKELRAAAVAYVNGEDEKKPKLMGNSTTS